MPKILQKTSVITRAALLLTLVGLLAGGSSIVRADSFDIKINSLKDQNSKNQQALVDLGLQASSYQGAISELRARINALDHSIVQNQAQQNLLTKQIATKKREINHQRGVLGEVLRSMYVDGDISTIEMLATSNNLSDYVDKEEYRNAVQNQIQETLAQIALLQKQLQTKKTKVEQLIASQKEQQSQLSADKQKQSSLLAYTQQQQSDFSSKIKKNNSEIAKLKTAQIAENCRIFGCGGGTVGGGNYPWGNAKCIHYPYSVNGPCDNYDWGVNGNPYRWDGGGGGWGYRNCTDWVYFRTGSRAPTSGQIRATGVPNGNATYWDDAARAMGKRVSDTPHVGDTAQKNGGYGHVMYVEAVNHDSSGNIISVTISDYNRAGDGKYRFSDFPRVGGDQYRNPTSGVVYSLNFITW